MKYHLFKIVALWDSHAGECMWECFTGFAPQLSFVKRITKDQKLLSTRPTLKFDTILIIINFGKLSNLE